jgi:hypothetical protein
MSIYYDGLEFMRDNFEIVPKKEWRILGVDQAKKPIRMPRLCRPNCEAFQVDFDKRPLCQYGCQEYVLERHIIDTNELVYTLLFAVNTLDVHEGFAWYVGDKYLRSFLGDDKVNRMLKDYNKLIETPETNLEDYLQEDENVDH